MTSHLDFVQALKNALPAPLRGRLRAWRGETSRKLIVLDRVKDFSVLRRVTPYRRSFGIQRGKCIDRYYIEQFLEKHSADVQGHVLEVQTNDYTKRFGGTRVTLSDVVDLDNENPKRTITADLTQCAGIPDNTFDCILCTQTLLLIFDVPAALREMYRILKPGGVLLSTMPGIAKICERELIGGAGEDYWRFTAGSALRLFGKDFGERNVQVTTYGNVLTAISFLHGLVTEELTANELNAHDPEYQLIIGVAARKAGSSA